MKKPIYFINYIKAFAAISVIFIHFRLNLEGQIPDNVFTPKVSLFFSIIYQLFISCVPLFMITTGYLSTKKNYNKKLLLSLLKTISLYIICSLLAYIMLHFFKGVSFTFKEIINNIMRYQLIGYAWYVEMYIGLLLLSPLFNKVINHSTKKEMKQFIVILLLVVSVPAFINSLPQTNSLIHLPRFWQDMYPIVYYFIGAYFKNYVDFSLFSIKLKRIIFTLLAVTFTFGILLNFINANPRTLSVEGSYPSLLIVLQSVLIFTFIGSICNKQNKYINSIAQLTLPIYLMSFAVDQLIYPYLLSHLANPKTAILFFPIIPIIIFSLSFILATMTNIINEYLCKFSYLVFKINIEKLLKLEF